MSKRILIPALFFLFLCSLTYAQNSDIKKFAGTWKGTYSAEGEEYTAYMVFTVKEGKLSGSAMSSEQQEGSEPLEMENLVIKGNKISFGLMSSIKYEGTFNQEKQIIEGTLTGRNGNEVKLDMTKEPEKTNDKKTVTEK